MAFNKDRLKKARENKGLSGKGLLLAIRDEGEECREYTSTSTVSNWENGRGKPRLTEFDSICKICEVSPNYLLEFDEEMKDAEKALIAADYFGVSSDTIEALSEIFGVSKSNTALFEQVIQSDNFFQMFLRIDAYINASLGLLDTPPEKNKKQVTAKTINELFAKNEKITCEILQPVINEMLADNALKFIGKHAEAAAEGLDDSLRKVYEKNYKK